MKARDGEMSDLFVVFLAAINLVCFRIHHSGMILISKAGALCEAQQTAMQS